MRTLNDEIFHHLYNLASSHVNSNDSSILTLREAMTCYNKGMYGSAWRWCIRSLFHSVGIFHPAYQEAFSYKFD